MQPTKPANSEHSTSQHIATDEQDILQQSMSLFELPVIPQVEMAFPNVISGTSPTPISSSVTDLNKLFAQQEKLFGELDEPGEDSQSEPEAPAESAELQAIRQIYEQS